MNDALPKNGLFEYLSVFEVYNLILNPHVHIEAPPLICIQGLTYAKSNDDISFKKEKTKSNPIYYFIFLNTNTKTLHKKGM